MSAPRTAGPYPWPGWLGWCPMQRSRTRLRVAMVGMVQIISGLDCDGNNNLITATTRPSTTSSSYTILPLCFSSTHTRQSANSAYHNSQPTAEAGLITNFGSIIIGALITFWTRVPHHFSSTLKSFQNCPNYKNKAENTSVGPQNLHCSDSPNTT